MLKLIHTFEREREREMFHPLFCQPKVSTWSFLSLPCESQHLSWSSYMAPKQQLRFPFSVTNDYKRIASSIQMQYVRAKVEYLKGVNGIKCPHNLWTSEDLNLGCGGTEDWRKTQGTKEYESMVQKVYCSVFLYNAFCANPEYLNNAKKHIFTKEICSIH